MIGEKNLTELIANMQPELLDDEFVFLNVPHHTINQYDLKQVFALINEKEASTLILPVAQANEWGLKTLTRFRLITLQIHSSLEAVGLTAAFAQTLASVNISANVVAGFYHDHIFVASDQADAAVSALISLSEQHREG